jgi:hypothetical protein
MKLILVLLILSLLLPPCLFAFQNEPREFRGIKWGSSAEIQKDLFLYKKDGDVSIYNRKNDKMQIGEVKSIKNIYYVFFKNKFFKVTINLQEKDSIENYKRLTEMFENLYGFPSKREDQKGDFFINKPIIINRSWKGKMVNVDTSYMIGFPYIPYSFPDGCEVNYGEATKSVACADYTYIPIAKECDRNKREQTKLKNQKLDQEQKKKQKKKAENAKKDL